MALKQVDREIYDAIMKEKRRQKTQVELIASENFTSQAVREAMGSVLTNKYAEGYPGKRYYHGCENVDIVENLAIDRCKRLFGAEHVNVQPHSGAQANFAVFFALLKPGDTFMGMDLNSGGHLTHGLKINFSGAFYNCIPYGLDPKTEEIDYDMVEKLAIEHKPKMIIAGGSAYSKIIDFARFADIAHKVGAYLMVDMAHIAGLVATGLHPSPVPYADVVTTTTHKTLRGPRGGIIMCKEYLAKKIDKALFPGEQGGPLEHVIAGKAVAFYEALQPEFKKYQKQVLKNAKALASALVQKGFRIVSGGTENHLMLVDLTAFGITGDEMATLLHEANITVNKNLIVNDPRPASQTSGIRIGTPAVTTCGFNEKDMQKIANCIYEIAKNKEKAVKNVKNMVKQIWADVRSRNK